MFDLRYHVASLAAVFLALTVGIILGVALSGKIRGAEDSLSAGRIAELESQLDAERERGSSEQERLQHSEDLINDAYPALMENRLVDRGYAIVFLGPVDGELRSAIEKTLADADGTPVRLFAFELPVDPASLNGSLESNETLS
ncbi:MAG TPA: copper transporter, partial [Gaiellaceae bacterium]|nr:copper transporter [Gaiellaceae bacterium]